MDRCLILETDLLLTSGAGDLTADPTGYRVATANGRKSNANSTYGFPCKRFTGANMLDGTGVNPVSESSVATNGAGIGRPGLDQTDAAVTAGKLNYVDASTGNNLSLRQFPLANAMASIDVSINGTHFTTNPGQYIQAVMRL